MFSFITLPVDEILEYMGDLVGDFLPLIVIVLGLGIGFWVLDRILHRKGD